MNERRGKGLCYNCDECYVQVISVKSTNYFYWMGKGNNMRLTQPIRGKEETQREPNLGIVDLCACISGCYSISYPASQRNIKGCLVVVFIDSGSSYNFLDLYMTK